MFRNLAKIFELIEEAEVRKAAEEAEQERMDADIREINAFGNIFTLDENFVPKESKKEKAEASEQKQIGLTSN